MNYKKSYYITGIVIIIIAMLTVIFSCETKPTEPKNDNIFDSLNSQTSGDPFNLTARIGEGRIILEWNTPIYEEPKFYKIYRSELGKSSYVFLKAVDINLNKYYDNGALNGSTYYYKMNITLANDTESSIEQQEPAKIFIPEDTDRAPNASFFASLDEYNEKLLHFNAAASSDYEKSETIEYRWDFEGDGNWNTDWLTQDTISFTYPEVGDYYATLTIRSQNSFTDEISKWVGINSPLTDIDGNEYKIVKIGNQYWMAENLKVTHYCNGDPIPNVTGDSEWSYSSNGAYCNYDNNIANVSTYGRLYNGYAIDDSRMLAPAGWHVPMDEEWKELEMFLGMSQSEADDTRWRGTDEGSKLKATNGWNENGSGANESGFSGLPSGFRSRTGSFRALNNSGYWWSFLEPDNSAWSRALGGKGYTKINRKKLSVRYGHSLRCVRD